MVNVSPFANQGFNVLVDTPAARITEISVASGQPVPEHKHTSVEELCYCLHGELTVEIHGQSTIILHPGERCSIPANRDHRLVNNGKSASKFLLVHRGGAFDFIKTER